MSDSCICFSKGSEHRGGGSLEIKTLGSPATEKFENQWITQRNDSSILNLPYPLDQGLSSPVTKEGRLSQMRVQLEDLAHGVVRVEHTAYQEPVARRSASPPDLLMSKVWSGGKSSKLGPRKLEFLSTLIKCAAFTNFEPQLPYLWMSVNIIPASPVGLLWESHYIMQMNVTCTPESKKEI